MPAVAGIFAAALLFGACSSQSEPEEIPDTETVPMSFGVSASRGLTTEENIIGSPFAVWGNFADFYDSSKAPALVFENEEVAFTGGNWGYDNVQYWFPGQIYKFLALHPAPATASAYDVAKGSLSYDFSTADNRTVDLLYAAHRRECMPNLDINSTKKVSFDFKHALAVVHIKVKADAALAVDQAVTIVSARLHGVYGTAAFELGVNNDGSTLSNWNVAGRTPTSQDSPLVSQDEERVLNPGESAELFINDNTPLLLIPQSVRNNATISVTYRIGSGAERNANVSLFAPSQQHGGRWRSGYTYGYTMTIQDTDNIIFGVPTVSEWVDSEGGNYII